jgi:hypothetical protein
VKPQHLQLLLTIAGVLLLLTATQAFGQGCAQCLDSTRATPPAVQAAYRRAILLLVGAASALFTAGLILFRREP